MNFFPIFDKLDRKILFLHLCLLMLFLLPIATEIALETVDYDTNEDAYNSLTMLSYRVAYILIAVILLIYGYLIFTTLKTKRKLVDRKFSLFLAAYLIVISISTMIYLLYTLWSMQYHNMAGLGLMFMVVIGFIPFAFFSVLWVGLYASVVKFAQGGYSRR